MTFAYCTSVIKTMNKEQDKRQGMILAFSQYSASIPKATIIFDLCLFGIKN